MTRKRFANLPLSVHYSKRGMVTNAAGEPVAVIDGSVDGAPEDWALLFAAAPDLLAALKETLRASPRGPHVKLAQAAIARAEGRK